MTLCRSLTTLALTLAIAAPAALSAQDRATQAAVDARQGQFANLALNLGVIGGMARGNIDYDAETAQAAADNIVAISTLDQRFSWPEGSDMMSIDGTRALPAIWDNLDDVVAKWADMGEAALVLQAAAGTGQEALGPALGGLGGACTACHDDYRAEE